MRLAATPLALLATGALLAGCTQGADTSDDPLTVGGMTETVVIEDFKYAPGNLQVPLGATVTFENRDSAVHDAKADEGAWETERLGDDEQDVVVFDQAGEYNYHCTLHTSMKAKITVIAP